MADPDSNPLLDFGAHDATVENHTGETAIGYDTSNNTTDYSAGDNVDVDANDTSAVDDDAGDAIETVVEAVVLPVAAGATIINLSAIVSATFALGLALLSNVLFGAAFWVFHLFVWPYVKRQIKQLLYRFSGCPHSHSSDSLATS